MSKEKIVKGQIEKYKENLNTVLEDDNVNLVDEEILKISEHLDKLIVEYYRENKKCE
ncbi:aspartyl-phosphate phosphatase Spo0E family protein [Anaeromicrobium sediminis]|uniref:Spo0E family sporulation regulatory protein-aspartic acid phosphatase n=1 Tax=Anaeromicrobium sediminis TaxID=1478221 RepID=A0A267MG41_9FIRM|nr:aspartyl-phosphate phosphatase Spo0E family protein [Anaeromicrobium sediminis]PAB57845.1 hypothetical protein CCE28_17755 [Anaeromicrobium sediminis]